MTYGKKCLAITVAVVTSILGGLAIFFVVSSTPQVSARMSISALTGVGAPPDNHLGSSSNLRYTMAATGSSEVTGSFEVGADATTITAVVLTDMTPQVTSSLTISVQDDDSLGNTQQIRVILLFDPGDASPSDNDFTQAASGAEAVDTLAVFTWTVTGTFANSSFVLTSPTTGSWSHISTTNPSEGATSGDFVLNFQPGKVAAFAVGGSLNDGWDVYVEVTDSTSTDVASSNTGVGTAELSDRSMGSFASVSVDPVSVSFGTLTSGVSGAKVTDPSSGVFVTTSISNKDGHSLRIQSSNTWTDGTTTLNLVSTVPGTNELRLKADDDADIAGAQILTSSAVSVTDHSSVARDTIEVGTDTDIGLFLDLGTVAASANPFTGTITMTVVN